MEVWKDIIGYENCYQISSFGRIKSVERVVSCRFNHKRIVREKILKQQKRANYTKIELSKCGIEKSYSVSRLVAQTFIPNPNNYPMVLHRIESIPQNNSVENLMWGTQNMNMQDMFSKHRSNRQSKLEEFEIIEVRKKYSTGLFSKKTLSNEYNVSLHFLRTILENKRWSI